jgi:hypothetical protein
MNEKLIAEFLDKKNTFAVVGASRNPEKYGHQVFKDLRNAGYEVYCVNPKADEVLGAECYPNIKRCWRNPMLWTSWFHLK